MTETGAVLSTSREAILAEARASIETSVRDEMSLLLTQRKIAEKKEAASLVESRLWESICEEKVGDKPRYTNDASRKAAFAETLHVLPGTVRPGVEGLDTYSGLVSDIRDLEYSADTLGVSVSSQKRLTQLLTAYLKGS